jgi:hypothetical protein
MTRSPSVYVRFVCFHLVGSQRQRVGLFQALDAAQDSNIAPSWALRQIGEIYQWFNENLAVPDKFSRDREGQPGLSWFKPAATEHIRQMHQLKLALEACGVHMDVLTTRNPGLIVWEDQHQIVAEPGAKRF